MAAIWSDVGLSRLCKSLLDGALDSDAVRTNANWALKACLTSSACSSTSPPIFLDKARKLAKDPRRMSSYAFTLMLSEGGVSLQKSSGGG